MSVNQLQYDQLMGLYRDAKAQAKSIHHCCIVCGAEDRDLGRNRCAQCQGAMDAIYNLDTVELQPSYNPLQKYFSALITVRATWAPSGLPLGSPWWTERRWREINGCPNRRKHRPRFLTEKPLRCGRAVCTRQEKVVHRRQTCTLSRTI